MKSGPSGSNNPYITKKDYLFYKTNLKLEYFYNTKTIREYRKEIKTLGQTEQAIKIRSELQSKIAVLSKDQRDIIDDLTFLKLRAEYSKVYDIVEREGFKV